MSLRERLRGLPAIPLNVSVLLAVVSTLSLSFLAFHLIANRVQQMEILPTFDKFDEMQLESARSALQRRGREGLQDYLSSLDRLFGEPHYLLDARGIDLVTGEDRSRMLPLLRRTRCAYARTDIGRSRIVRRTGSTGSPPRGNWVLHKSGPFFPTISS